MPKLPTLKSKELVKILKRVGFSFIRQRGSHRIYVKENIGITIPYHNKDLRRGTLHKIIKQTSLSVNEFLNLLKSKK